jgi:hypothetical protein
MPDSACGLVYCRRHLHDVDKSVRARLIRKSVKRFLA